jgi:ketosteroid isomerase-like protein
MLLRNRIITRTPIAYYSEDAVSFSNGKMPLEGKKAIHESMKSELLTFERIKIAFEQIHASNDGNMVVVGIQRYRLHKHKTNSGHFMSLFKKEGQVHLHQRYGDFKHAIGHRLKLKKDT